MQAKLSRLASLIGLPCHRSRNHVLLIVSLIEAYDRMNHGGSETRRRAATVAVDQQHRANRCLYR